MRLKKVSLTAAISLLAGLTTTAVGLSSNAWADTAVPLSLPHYSHMLVDPAHQHLFFSSGVGNSTILVTDYDGVTVRTIDNEPGAIGLALSPDGSTVYAALYNGDAISAIDTTSLNEAHRYSTGAGSEPRSVAYTGGKVWFGYGGATEGNIGSIDTSSNPATVTLNTASGWYSAPTLAADPSAPGVLLAADQDTSPPYLTRYDVSSGSPVVGVRRWLQDSASVSDMQITPDGQDVVLATGAPYYHQVLKLSDLSADGTYPSTPYPNSVAIAPDGAVAAGSNASYDKDVYVYQAHQSSPINTYDFGSSSTLASSGLAWAPDESRLFAVTADVYGANPTLHVLSNPEATASALTLAGPATAVPTRQLTLTGSLTSTNPIPAGQQVKVTRVDSANPDGIALPDAVTDANGGFTVTDTPTAEGATTYRVSYEGDSKHLSANASYNVQVAKLASTMTLTAPATSTRTAQLTITGTLANGPYAAGEMVQLTKKDLAHSAGYSIGTATVGTDGSFTIHDTPAIGGNNTYTVSYPGDNTHKGSTASATVQVSRTASALSVTTNASTYSYGATATATAHLGTTYNGRTISIYAQPYGGTKTLVKTGTVDSHGNLVASYKLSRNTVFSAVFAGDYRYAPATATRTVYDRVKVAETLSGYYTSTYYGSTLYRVYHHTAKEQLNVAVTPNKAGQCVFYRVQQYYSSAWHTLTTSPCFALSSASTDAGWVSLSNAINSKFRMAAEYVHSSKDNTNVSTWGAWQYFTVRS
ncbi:hypothetical protein SAMN05446589_4481 [Streptomyces sp. OV198]|jgi:hypothetical protein|uniref:hypothetical protein n=1 Tax=Streptomyces sp. OV198 TaxID=1882787 RepID=UPI000BD91502|nr:hypothetical protein [Streptomyces sp. OV198]SOE72527.1 hypothetical protein SAMN05446589_4481 [Streptomyces sp. OV198]